MARREIPLRARAAVILSAMLPAMLPAMLLAMLLLLLTGCGGEATELPPVPAGLPPVPVPADNPLTVEKVELGKLLFFDRRLSRDRTISCATCHDPKHAWAEPRRVSVGILNQTGRRNAPTVLNAAYLPVQFWDGRAATLEEQARFPIEDPIEMGHRLDRVVLSLSTNSEYRELFEAAFGIGVTEKNLREALAAFQRTLLTGNSPYDRHAAGEPGALTEPQARGLEVFEGRGRCATCHPAPIFSDGKFHNAGIGLDSKKPDEGRKEATNRDEDRDRFRTPHLREVESTGPYLHDGSVETLEEAVRIMARGGKENPGLAPEFGEISQADLTEDEIHDLVEFLRSLSGEFPVMEPPEIP